MNQQKQSSNTWLIALGLTCICYYCLSLLSVLDLAIKEDILPDKGIPSNLQGILVNILPQNSLVIKDRDNRKNVIQFISAKHTQRINAFALVGARRLPKIVSASTFMTKGPYRCRNPKLLTA